MAIANFFIPLTVGKILNYILTYKDIIVILSFILLIVFYSVGHITAQFAAWIFEEGIVAKGLGHPKENLFRMEEYKWWQFSKFRASFEEDFINRFEKLYGKIFEKADKTSRFSDCYNYVKVNSEETNKRLNTFLALYDYSRNLSLSVFVLAGSFAVNLSLVLAALSLVTVYVFFVRYLKFLRLFTEEIFESFVSIVLKNETNQVDTQNMFLTRLGGLETQMNFIGDRLKRVEAPYFENLEDTNASEANSED